MKNKNIDFKMIFFPLIIVLGITLSIIIFPETTKDFINTIHDLLVNKLGFFYILLGLFVVFGSIWLACSKYGKIQLGKLDKPRHSNSHWGAMIFTSTMAADILYWSLIEWVYYYEANPMGIANMSEKQKQLQASTYPLFHWGPTPWAFYILPAVAYAYMFFVKGTKKQKLSEACRPIIKDHADKFLGKFIDILAVVGLLAGTTTTFSLATPLLAGAVSYVTGIPNTKMLSLIILVIIGVVFTITVLSGMKAISKLATVCVVLFGTLLAYVFIMGPTIFIVESGISGIGNLIQNFLSMATYMDPSRTPGTQGFAQQWTIFYWAYWISWFVATPFFIAKISEGRTIRNMIGGAFFYGIAGTFTSFIVFGNFGLYQQVSGNVDAVSMINNGASPTEVIITLFSQIKGTKLVLVILVLAMIAFYASTFDAITLVVAGFTQKELDIEKEPNKRLRGFWSILFIVLPIGFIWADSKLNVLQTLSIAAAFPLGIIMLIIIFGFFKSLKADEKNLLNNNIKS